MAELGENMAVAGPAGSRSYERVERMEGRELAASGVSWGAILAGAVGASALSLILLLLGSGLGLSSVSPWSSQGASATTFGVATILWISFTQIAASGMGGYLAGRLRTKWAGLHTDEVYFRDTAHGFMAWAVATLATAALLGSAIGSVLGAGVQAGASIASGGATAVGTAGAAGAVGAAQSNGGESSTSSSSAPMGYFVDSLFRRDPAAANAGATASPTPTPTPTPTAAAAAAAGAQPEAQPGASERSNAASSAEASRIFLNGIRTGSLSPDDTRYAGQLVAQRTGLSQQDAEKRVTDTFARTQASLKEAADKAKAAADAARKASAYGALWLFVSLLIGAFVASLAATYGGRRRDF
jgi:hypothetical protein